MTSLSVLFRDHRVAIVDKPSGMPVHPGRGDPTISVEDLFATLGRARHGPFLAHRLDRDTSGCLVIALRRSALLAAQGCFADGRARKLYWAITDGPGPDTEAGTVDAPLAKVADGRSWRMAARPDGRRAITDWQVRARFGPRGPCWLELRPRTGRTHQIRAHCALLGSPISGDRIYGRGDTAGLLLHARAIALPLPDGAVSAVAPVPARMRDFLTDPEQV